MVTWTKRKYVGKHRRLCAGDCVSTDSKPITTEGENIANGSVLREMDTGKVFKFNEASGAWIEYADNGSGGDDLMDVSVNGM